MAALALSMFIALFAFGDQMLGGIQGENAQLAMFASFLFGIIVGWKTNR